MRDEAQTPEVSPWQLWVDGHYEAAIALYTEMYETDGRTSNLYNRGSIHVEIGEYEKALEDFALMASVQDPAYRTDGQHMFQGICYWYLNQPQRAVEMWKAGLDAPYTDAAGGVRQPAILLYAGLRLDDMALQKESVRLLRKHARCKLNAWPGPIVPFLLDKIDEQELLRHTQSSSQERLIGRWQCQAAFYSAVHALHHDDRARFGQHIARCAASQDGRLEHEHYLARWEIERNLPFPAFS